MRTLSLFSGIGGFDLGFARAGMTVVGVCEIDKHAQKILQRHFPEATLHDDVRKVHYARGSVDLICGGFPCQDLSVAGKRRGLDGERSGLWFEFARIINEAEPQWVVIENVPGLFSSDGGRDFAVIIQWLAQRGYGVGWRVLDAQGFGLAQRRKRVFIVASFGSQRGCTVLLEPESVRWHHTPSRRTRQGDTAATAKCLTAHGQRLDYDTETMIPYAIQGNIVDRHRGGANGTGISQSNVSYTLTAVDRHAVAWKMRVTGGNPTGERGGKNTHPGGQGYLESDKAFTLATTHDQFVAYGVQDIAPTLRAEAKQSLMSGDGNINAPLAIALNGQHGQWTALNEQSHTLSTSRVEQVLWESSHGYDPARVMANQDIVPTLSAKMGTGGNNVPLLGVRRLTPTECERLQGFPDGWTSGQSDTNRYKQLGNAVAVPVAEWIGRRIMENQS